MTIKKKLVVAVAGGLLTIGAAAPSALADHAGQYNATSPGNEECHDTGQPGGDSTEPSSTGLGRAAENDRSAINTFSCDDQP